MSRDRFPIAIGARKYVTDVEQISWRTVEVTRRGVDQGAGVGESSLSNEQVWRRTRESWHLGAGQEWADIPDDSSPFRFHESHGIDPFTKRQLTLLEDVEQKRTYAGSIHEMAAEAGYIYIVENAAVYFTSNPTAASPTWTAMTGLGGGAIDSIVAGAGSIYVSDGTQVFRANLGTAAAGAAWSAVSSHLLGVCHGRVMASSGAELFELTAAGTKTTIWTHPDSRFRWQGAIAVPKGIIAFGQPIFGSGHTGEVYAITVDDVSGALAAPQPATHMPEGETVDAMAFNAGFVGMLTAAGFRLATVNDDVTLTYGPALTLGASGANSLQMDGLAAYSEGFFVACLFAGHDTLAVGTSSHEGVAKIRIDRFVDTLVPAWSEFIVGSVGSSTLNLVVVDDRPYYSVFQSGIWGPNPTTYVASGELSSGWMTFSVPERKQPDHVRVHTETQDADTSTVLKAFSEASPASPLATATVADGATSAVGFASGDNGAERFYLRATLASENATDVPTVRRLTLGATPVPFISDEIVLPLVLTDTVADDEGSLEQLDPLDDWVFLIGLRDTQQRVNVTIGGRTYVARIAELAVVNGGLGGGNGLDGWTDKRDWPSGTWLCRLVTMED